MSIANILLGYAAAAAGAATDAYFKYVTMLLPGNGTNGAQNNTFLDSSTNNFTITRNGNTTQGTFTPYGSNWSNYFDGTTDYLTVGASANFGMGTGTFSFECWVFPTSNPANGPGTVFDARSAATSEGWVVRVFADLTVGLYDGPNNNYVYSTGTVTMNQWNHIAVVRSSTSSGGVAFYINGNAAGTATVASNLGTSWSPWIGGNRTAGYDFNGYISNLRVVKSATVYTGAFTPSTTPLTTYGSGTNALLTCQSNRFIDNSGNSLSLTVSGTPSVQRFSPFSPSAAYSTTTNGGSGYFDGTGDYLNAGSSSNLDNFTGDFCLEVWIYPTITSTSASQVPLARWTTGTRSYILYITATNNYIRIHYNNDTINLDSTTAVKINAWNHVVANRSGSTLTLFLNGVSVSTATSSSTIVASTSTFIGATETADPQSFFNGYISDVRIVKGSSVYGTSNFTPPTAPLTAITNTQLLLNMTNAGIIDNAMMNDLETVGNAQISTTQSKFGGSSMYFDGTGDYLVTNVGTSNLYAFGTGDFTIECWLYTTQTANEFMIIDFRSSNGASPMLGHDSTRGVFYYLNTSYAITSNTVLTTNTWYHLAVARSGSSTKLFINGTQAGSTFTDSTSLTVGANKPVVGINGTTLNSLALNGYIDDLRITKGYARYTANFTAPSSAFPTS